MMLLYLLGYIFAWPIQFIFFKKKVYYEDKKDTSRFVRKGALIVSNHRSLMDFMVSIFLFHFRKLYCLMSELIFSHGGFISFMTKVMGGIKIDRRNYDFSFINTSVNLLNKNKLLIIYPEGRVNTKGGLLTFHPTYLLIALRSNKPIIPIYTDGTYSIKRRTRIVIGKKIYLSDYCNTINPSKEELERLNNIVKDKINSLAKICKEEKNHDKYPQGFRFKFFFKDMGRLIAFIMNTWFRTRVFNKGKHKKNLKIKGGGVIIVNHVSFADPFVCLNAFWRRRIYIATAEVVFGNHKIRSKLITSLGCVRIDRNINDVDAYNKCINILKAGNLLVVFGGGKIDVDFEAKFKAGAAIFAYKAGVPVYTAYLEPHKKWYKRFHLYMGNKYDLKEMYGNKKLREKDLEDFTEILEQDVRGLKEKYKNEVLLKKSK